MKCFQMKTHTKNLKLKQKSKWALRFFLTFSVFFLRAGKYFLECWFKKFCYWKSAIPFLIGQAHSFTRSHFGLALYYILLETKANKNKLNYIRNANFYVQNTLSTIQSNFKRITGARTRFAAYEGYPSPLSDSNSF